MFKKRGAWQNMMLQFQIWMVWRIYAELENGYLKCLAESEIKLTVRGIIAVSAKIIPQSFKDKECFPSDQMRDWWKLGELDSRMFLSSVVFSYKLNDFILYGFRGCRKSSWQRQPQIRDLLGCWCAWGRHWEPSHSRSGRLLVEEQHVSIPLETSSSLLICLRTSSFSRLVQRNDLNFVFFTSCLICVRLIAKLSSNVNS